MTRFVICFAKPTWWAHKSLIAGAKQRPPPQKVFGPCINSVVPRPNEHQIASLRIALMKRVESFFEAVSDVTSAPLLSLWIAAEKGGSMRLGRIFCCSLTLLFLGVLSVSSAQAQTAKQQGDDRTIQSLLNEVR